MTRYLLAALALSSIAISAQTASAMIREEADARLDVSYNESGIKTAGIVFRASVGDIEAVKTGIANWFGVDPSKVVAKENVDEYPLILGTGARLNRTAPLVYADTLDQAALRSALAAAGVDSVQVVAFLPPSPIAVFGDLPGINMFGVFRHEEIFPVAKMSGVWTVRFGWRYRDLAIYIVTPVLFLLAFELALRSVRRCALAAEGPERPAAIFQCGKIHHLASLLFLIVWPGLILMIVPMSYLLYVPREFYGAGLALLVFLPILIAFLYTIWIRVALHPVFQRFPEPNWSRRELVAQGCVIGMLCLTMSLFFGASLLMVVFGPDTGLNGVWAVIVVAWLAPAFTTLLYSRFVRSIVRTPESSPEGKRLDELANWLEIKDTPALTILYYPRTVLARSIEGLISINAIRSRTQRGICMLARLLAQATPDELDALLLVELDKVKKNSHWKNVSLVRAAYKGIVFPALFLVVLVSCILVGERDSITYFFNGWCIFAAVYIVPAFILAAGRRQEMKLVRRYTRMTDEAVLKQLGDPEAQIRAILREARVNCVPLEVRRWLRPVMAPSPIERIGHLAERSGISEERIAALRSHIDASTNVASNESDTRIAACIDRLLIRNNLFRVLPMPGFFVPPVLVAWAYHKVLAGYLPLWVLLPLVVPICSFTVLGLQNVTWRLGKRRMVSALRDNIPLQEAAGVESVPVEFSHIQRPRDVRGRTMRSAGFLYWNDDALCLRNDDTNLLMHADAIENVSMRLEPSGFFPAFELRVDCRQTETGVLKEYRIQLLNSGMAHGVNLETLALYAQLRQWWTVQTVNRAESREEDVSHTTGPVVDASDTMVLAVSIGIVSAVFALYLGWRLDLPMNWSASNSAFITPTLFLAMMGLNVLFQRLYVRWVVQRLKSQQD